MNTRLNSRDNVVRAAAEFMRVHPTNANDARSAASVLLTREGYSTWEAVLLAIGPGTTLEGSERNRIARLALLAHPARLGEIQSLNRKRWEQN